MVLASSLILEGNEISTNLTDFKDWLPIIISTVAFVLSFYNAKLTWLKPFTLEYFPSLHPHFSRDEHFLFLKVKSIFYNPGNQAGLIVEMALVQLSGNRIVEKYPLVAIEPILSLEQMYEYQKFPDSFEEQLDFTFSGIFLEPHMVVKHESTFRIMLQGPTTNDFEKWNIAYRLSSENYFRKADVEINAALKNFGKDRKISVLYPTIHVSHKKNRRAKLIDALPEVGIDLG